MEIVIDDRTRTIAEQAILHKEYTATDVHDSWICLKRPKEFLQYGEVTFIQPALATMTKKVRSENIEIASESLAYLILKRKYSVEKIRQKISNDKADNVFAFVASHVSKLTFKECDVEITPNQALKFILALDDSKLLMISKSFEIEDDNNQIIFSIFINSELIVTNASDLTHFTEGVQKFLSV